MQVICLDIFSFVDIIQDMFFFNQQVWATDFKIIFISRVPVLLQQTHGLRYFYRLKRALSQILELSGVDSFLATCQTPLMRH